MGDQASDRVKSAGRVLDLVEILARHEGGLSFTALLQETGFPRSSLHALLGVLVDRRYAHFDEASRLYSAGIQVWQNGQSYLKSRDLVREARPAMEAIAVSLNETVQLARLDGTENVYLAKVDSTHALRLQSEVGVRLSAHATGLGKALLSGLSDDEIRRRFADKPLPRMTKNTITTMAGLLREVARIRGSGFSIDDEEYTPGVFCVAVPVQDHTGAVAAAMSMSVPVFRLFPDVLANGLALLARGSLETTRRLGGRPNDARLEGLQKPATAKRALAQRGLRSASRD